VLNEDQLTALNRLPGLAIGLEKKVLQSTGTDGPMGPEHNPKSGTLPGTLPVGLSRVSASTIDHQGKDKSIVNAESENPLIMARNGNSGHQKETVATSGHRNSSLRTLGLGPRTYALKGQESYCKGLKIKGLNGVFGLKTRFASG